MQNNTLTSNIYDGTTKTLGAINESNRLLTSEISGVNKNVTDNAFNLGVALERTSAQTQAAVERVAGENRITTVTADAASREAAANTARDIMGTVERTSAIGTAATDRNGSLLLQTVERVAGEGRLTTTVTDAASREAAANQARDLSVAIERNGANGVNTTNQTHSALLAAIERNSGENRMTTVTVDGQSQARLADTRRDIIGQLNNTEGEILAAIQSSSQNILNTATNTAWETRQNQTTHYAALLNEINKSSATNQLTSSSNHSQSLLEMQKAYSSLLLEEQKNKEHLSSKSDLQFAAMVSKSDGHYSNIMLEQHKVKECLASQSAQQFAISQLETQKIKESLSAQMAEAKYEALKNKMELSQQLSECCCEIKEKVDSKGTEIISLINDNETDDLRQQNTVLATENFFLDGDWGYGRGDWGHGHRGGHGRGRHGGHGGRR
ncbi:MAG: hypothetical protein EB127_12030 [Alphaproteobacteria bacterium]|nr:hypothetical protein [Alphaproteobacteria bacterium]